MQQEGRLLAHSLMSFFKSGPEPRQGLGRQTVEVQPEDILGEPRFRGLEQRLGIAFVSQVEEEVFFHSGWRRYPGPSVYCRRKVFHRVPGRLSRHPIANGDGQILLPKIE